MCIYWQAEDLWTMMLGERKKEKKRRGGRRRGFKYRQMSKRAVWINKCSCEKIKVSWKVFGFTDWLSDHLNVWLWVSRREGLHFFLDTRAIHGDVFAAWRGWGRLTGVVDGDDHHTPVNLLLWTWQWLRWIKSKVYDLRAENVDSMAQRFSL